MIPILKPFLDFFKAEKTTYARRKRTIEIVAQEQGIDINSIIEETTTILEREGRIKAIEYLTKRFRLPVVAAWRFVDKHDLK